MSAASSVPPDFDDRDQQPATEPQKHAPWKRRLIWIGVVLAALVLLVVVSISFVLHSNTAHRAILTTAQRIASRAVGTQVSIGNFAIAFSGISPTVDLYDVAVAGTNPEVKTPLLRADHLRLEIKIISLLRRQWNLQALLIEHPVANILTDRQGRDNLPQTNSSGGSTDMSGVFNMGVQRAVVTRGELYYNNRKSEIEADVQNLHVRTDYHAQPLSYTGTLAYKDGHLHVSGFYPMQHRLSADFVITPDELRLKNATLRSGQSNVVLNATVTDFSQPKIAGTYQVNLHGGEVQRILKNSSVPAGLMTLAGTFRYANQPNEPPLRSLQVEGNLHSGNLEIRTPQFAGPVRDLSGSYTLANDNFRLADLRAQVLGGGLRASATVNDLSGAQNSKLTADLSDISLAGLKTMFRVPALKDVGVSGVANAEVTATWRKGFNHVEANLRTNFNSRITPPPQASETAQPNAAQSKNEAAPIPVNGHVQAHYSSKNGFSVTDSLIQMPNTSVKLNGAMNSAQGLTFNLNRVDLQQVTRVIAAFTPSGEAPSVPSGLAGIASFNGKVRGTTESPHIQGTLTVDNLRINHSEWKSLRTDIDATPSSAKLSNGVLVATTQGRTTFYVTAELRKWSFTKESQFQVTANGDDLLLANLLGATKANMPAKGMLSFHVNAHGMQDAPIGMARIRLGNANVSGQPIQTANVDATSNGQLIQTNLGVKVPAGTATANGSFNLSTQDYQVQFQAVGIKLAQLAAVKAKGFAVDGELNVRANGQGNLKDPQLTASAEIPHLRVNGESVNNIALRADVGNHVAKVILDAQAVNTSLHGQGEVQLTGDYEAVASLNTQPIPLAPLVALYAPSQAGNITGQTEVHGDLRGPLKKPSALNVHISIPRLQVDYKNAIQLGAPQPIQIDFTNGAIEIKKAALLGTGTDLQFQGRIPVVDRSQQVSLLLQGTVDLKLAQMLNPDVSSSGQLVLDINSYGQRSDPNVEGQIKIVNATLAMGGAPLGLQNGNGVLTLTPNRLEVTRFEGRMGGGELRARGGLIYRPKIGFDLAVQAQGVRMLYPEGVRSGIAGNLTLTGTPSAAMLRGQINLQQLSFTPDFDVMNFLGQFNGTVAAPPSQGFTNNLQLQVNISAPNGIDLVSRELRVAGSVNLNVRGTVDEPVILGRVNLTDGDMIFRGNRYLLQGATVDFVNPTRTQPVLNASLNTTVEHYDVAIRLEGPVDRLRTSYTSDPSLPPADIINLLVFGKTMEAAAANPNPPGRLGAESAIASAVAGQVTNRISKIAGISQLSVSPTLGGTGSQGRNDPGATITVQQRVTGRIFVTFSTDVTSTERQVMQLQYQATPRFSVSGTRDQNGGFAVDTQINKKW